MLEIAFDRIDVTPDSNGFIGFSKPETVQPPRDLLYGRIFLLKDDLQSTLIISLDYGGLYLSAHDQWRQELAEAMNIPVNRVILHCLHQHDAPFINLEAAQKIDPDLDWSWFYRIREKIKNAAMALPDKLQKVQEIGWSESRVHGYASNRRVIMDDGSIAVRYSRCACSEVKNKPVGIIDPMLRTLAFFGEDGRMIAAWSFYATHPQVANEGKRFSADAPGEAMRLLAEMYPGIMMSLFNGCFGNITAGKYASSDDLEGNIRVFGKIIADAIALNLQKMERFPVSGFRWQREVFDFPVRYLTNEDKSKRRPMMVCALEAGEEYGRIHGEKYAVELLKLGEAKIIFVDGELFVEYQLFALTLVPEGKLAIVGNCGDTNYYIGTAEALANPAGYEVQGFCRVLPEFEDRFCNALKNLLR